MKKASPLLLAFLLVALQAVCQQKQLPEETLLIALKNGSVIYPEEIKSMARPLAKPYLRVDSNYNLNPENVKYYKDGDAYFFWAEVTETGEGSLLRLDTKGKVSTYFSNTVSKKSIASDGSADPTVKPDYFQVGNGAIRKISYENLSLALTDNMVSMQKLQEVRRLKQTNKICLIAGGSMMAAGIVHMYMLNNNNTKPPFIETGFKTRISPLFMLGAVTLTIPLANRQPLERKLEEAIAIYNR